jgi:hypothetical protein
LAQNKFAHFTIGAIFTDGLRVEHLCKVIARGYSNHGHGKPRQKLLSEFKKMAGDRLRSGPSLFLQRTRGPGVAPQTLSYLGVSLGFWGLNDTFYII